MQLLEARSPGCLAPFLELMDLTDYAVQFRYEAPMGLQRLDRVGLCDQILNLRNRVDALI